MSADADPAAGADGGGAGGGDAADSEDRPAALGPAPDAGAGVVAVEGLVDRPRRVAVDALRERADERFAATYRCASGERWGREWVGVPVADLFDPLDVHPEATHLLARSRDGHAACLPLSTAVEGVLAVERADGPTRAAAVPRLLAPGVDAARTVRDVVAVEFLALDADEDRRERERLGLD